MKAADGGRPTAGDAARGGDGGGGVMGYEIDPTLKDGDLCVQGPLVLRRGALSNALFTSAPGDGRVQVFAYSTALRAVASWLAETPDALEDLRTLRWALDQLGHIDEEQAVPTLDALVAALATDGGA